MATARYHSLREVRKELQEFLSVGRRKLWGIVITLLLSLIAIGFCILPPLMIYYAGGLGITQYDEYTDKEQRNRYQIASNIFYGVWGFETVAVMKVFSVTKLAVSTILGWCLPVYVIILVAAPPAAAPEEDQRSGNTDEEPEMKRRNRRKMAEFVGEGIVMLLIYTGLPVLVYYGGAHLDGKFISKEHLNSLFYSTLGSAVGFLVLMLPSDIFGGWCKYKMMIMRSHRRGQTRSNSVEPLDRV